MDLRDRVILITGAAIRVGRALANEMAAAGARLVLHHLHHEAEAQQALDEFTAQGIEAMTVRADVSQSDQVRDMFEAVDRRFGALDGLINNAAVFKRTPFPDLTEADWDYHLDINLKGVFLCCREAAKRMIPQGAGKIINIADVFGDHPWPGYLPYCVSKAGVVTLTQTLALTLARHNIQVNAIGPGTILFPDHYSPDDIARELARVPAGRPGSPADIARTARFLLEGPDYITGVLLPVDGGAGLT